MTEKQKKVIIVGIIIIMFMGLFPPWAYFLKTEKGELKSPVGYGLIFSPPKYAGGTARVNIDISRLIIQWVVVSSEIVAVWLLYK